MTDSSTPSPTLLITGPVGVGKTTVAFEVSELLEQQLSRPLPLSLHAATDLAPPDPVVPRCLRRPQADEGETRIRDRAGDPFELR